MYDRLPTPFGLVRGGVAPDHQKIKSVTRVYDKIAAHPEFRFYGNVEIGRDITHADLSALLPRDHLRGRRAHRPAHGHPGRGPARQPLGHRVRGLVQRPPRLPQPRLRPRRGARGGGRQRQRGDGRGAHPRQPAPRCSPQTDIADHALARAREQRHPRDPRARPARPGPGRLHHQGAEGARRAAGRRRGRRPGRRRARPAAQARRRRRRPTAPATRNLEVLRELRRAPADRRARGGSSCTSWSRRCEILGAERGRGPRRSSHNELYEARTARSARGRPSRDDDPAGRPGLPGDRLPGRARCRASRSTPCAGRHPQRRRADHRPAHRRAGRGRVRGRLDQARARRGSSAPTSRTPRRPSTRLLADLGRRAACTSRTCPRAACSSACCASARATSSPTRTGSSSTMLERSAARSPARRG